ncbi:MAG: hypothetical protein RSC48_07205 [Anaerorhabdus sp.]
MLGKILGKSGKSLVPLGYEIKNGSFAKTIVSTSGIVSGQISTNPDIIPLVVHTQYTAQHKAWACSCLFTFTGLSGQYGTSGPAGGGDQLTNGWSSNINLAYGLDLPNELSKLKQRNTINVQTWAGTASVTVTVVEWLQKK